MTAHETREARAIRRAVVLRAAEALAAKWTRPLDLANRNDDWTYPERPMSERVKDEVDASYRAGPPEDRSLVMRSPTCMEIAELLADAGLLAEIGSNEEGS